MRNDMREDFDEQTFDEIVSSLDYPMVIVTASSDGERGGCLAGFTTQCSIDPPRWIVCISKTNYTHGLATKAPMLAVHFPRASQFDLAILFGSQSGDEIDKFAHCDWALGPGDTPVLAATDWFVGRAITTWDAGDHTAILLDVLPEGSSSHAEESQLSFQQVTKLEAGHDAGE